MARNRFEGIGFDELAQATRNHGTPLEALRADLTPAGMHYLLIHYDVPFVRADRYRLQLEGFDRPRALTLEELRARPAVSMPVTLECAGNGRALLDERPVSQPWLVEAVGTAAWTGTPLGPLLEEAGVPEGTAEIVFTGLDRGVEGGEERPYERSLPVQEAMREDVLLVYGMNGQPLPPQHGAPLRLIVPGWYGMAQVKWLGTVTAVAEPYEGYQQKVAYRLRVDPDEPGTPLSRIRVRSLVIPPGVPGFPERDRFLAPGPTLVGGRAWSGSAPIGRVEVSTDDGVTWLDAELGPTPGPFAWRRWSFRWEASPGHHVLVSRATDAEGDTQPLVAEPNLGGYANNAVQRVGVNVANP
jgi:DMSO/TMAO reductase YedYZ molybdopterin-dependent catalytic subunit